MNPVTPNSPAAFHGGNRADAEIPAGGRLLGWAQPPARGHFALPIGVLLTLAFGTWAVSAADAPVPAPATPPPELTEAEKSEQQRRTEALERLARGDLGDAGEPIPDDTLPRNREARVIHSVPAEYPKEMAGTGLAAEVMLSVVVDRMGKASHVRVEDSSDPLFTAAALDAVNQWQFSPRVREGRISNAPMRITVPVSEEWGDRQVHDFPGGRIALESVRHDEEPDTPVKRFLGLRPVYPFDMLAEEKAGEVVIEFVVGDDGRPREFKIIEATHRNFAYACQGALLQWRFTPAEKAHRPVNARLRYRMSFQPDEIDRGLIALARELRAGRPGGLETPRSINQQPRVSRSTNPSSYDGTGGAPRRRRVTVEVVVTEQGEVRLPRTVSSPDPLSGYIALASVQYWKFEPARKNGNPVPVLVSMPVTF